MNYEKISRPSIFSFLHLKSWSMNAWSLGSAKQKIHHHFGFPKEHLSRIAPTKDRTTETKIACGQTDIGKYKSVNFDKWKSCWIENSFDQIPESRGLLKKNISDHASFLYDSGQRQIMCLDFLIPHDIAIATKFSEHATWNIPFVQLGKLLVAAGNGNLLTMSFVSRWNILIINWLEAKTFIKI